MQPPPTFSSFIFLTIQFNIQLEQTSPGFSNKVFNFTSVCSCIYCFFGLDAVPSYSIQGMFQIQLQCHLSPGELFLTFQSLKLPHLFSPYIPLYTCTHYKMCHVFIYSHHFQARQNMSSFCLYSPAKYLEITDAH